MWNIQRRLNESANLIFSLKIKRILRNKSCMNFFFIADLNFGKKKIRSKIIESPVKEAMMVITLAIR